MTQPSVSVLGRRDQLLAVGFGMWMLVGLFLDGWAHDNNKPETFFTPWHGLLYSGFTAAAAAAGLIAFRERGAPGGWRRNLPQGHGLTLVALGIFGTAAVLDLVWHEVLGIEVGVEALLSPTHLALLAAGLVALSAPLRAAWITTPRRPASLKGFLVPVLSLSLLTGLLGFFLLYLSPLTNDAAAAAFTRVANVPHDHPSQQVGELQQLLGIGSILMTTVLLTVPVLLLVRRWDPPAGAITTLVGVVVLMFVAMDEFELGVFVLAGLVSGAVIELARPRVGDTAGTAIGMSVLWLGYFATSAVTDTVAWTVELWGGVVVLAGLVSAGVGLLAAPLPRVGHSALDQSKS